MSTKYWSGVAEPVAQVTEAGIDTYDAATTYGITINGFTVSVAAITDEPTTIDALFAALNASTNPYFSTITWDRNGSGASSTIRGTSDVAGMPFTFTTYASGGTGSWLSPSNTVANSGPNDWANAQNWSGGAVPVSTDDVIFQDNDVNVCWGLGQSAVALNSLTIKKTFTGRIGLNYTRFAKSADGTTVSTTKQEYRGVYLEISASTVDIGEHYGAGNPGGSARILINLGSTASTVTVHATAGSAADTGRSAVALLCNNASTAVYVKEAKGGVGIASLAPDEVSTLSLVRSDNQNNDAVINIGAGTTLTTYYQANGSATLRAAATVTTVTIESGTITTEGDYTITTLNLNGGTVYQSHIKTAGDAVTNLNLNGGTLDTRRSGVARTISVLNLSSGTFIGNDGVAITTINEPAGVYTITTT